MLEDLREESSQAAPEYGPPDLDSLREQAIQATMELDREAEVRRRQSIMGFSPQQRFILALLLFFNVCLLGAMCLVALGKVWIP